MPHQDALVVGSGPNGLAAAIELARAGWSVTLYEAKDTIGGGLRTQALTRPGFRHDVCSAIHPLGRASPVFRGWPLERFGLEWIHPDVPLAHPLDDGTAPMLGASFEETAASLGPDGDAWRRLMRPFSERLDALIADLLGPLGRPRHPLLSAWFGLQAVQSGQGLAERWFRGPQARALFAGIAAHVGLPLTQVGTAAAGLVLGVAGHAVGWPMPRGGAQALADALAGYFEQLGGRIVTGHEVQTIEELPSATAVLFDLTPRQVLRIAGARLPDGYRRALERYRYGGGVFKVDWALSEPVPWTAAACRRAGTIHLGGTLPELVAAEAAPWAGRVSERPYVLLAQHTLFDDTRAPAGQHTLWGYCHVPAHSTIDMTERIERQIERFAPGFRDTILARHTMTAPDMERYNANYIGGDINGGAQTLRQILARPALRRDPYAMPTRGNGPALALCSASTPPGGGVHGLCGYHAAQSVLRRHA
ncbi:MAG: NAD(P)/FAD-dependent oxidoreductase [Bacteroidota bacterium]